eukprot:TRINITY_DN8157_c0_g1_i2.p2 TRINITY_DN8157_c0_g1~~TRINITY_DN8157_c0_g1_i2.p2  ORF type:complete len:184 (+),score=25.20 TRINITY_DN8157_c0_g1_i2:966-1517(+)
MQTTQPMPSCTMPSVPALGAATFRRLAPGTGCRCRAITSFAAMAVHEASTGDPSASRAAANRMTAVATAVEEVPSASRMAVMLSVCLLPQRPVSHNHDCNMTCRCSGAHATLQRKVCRLLPKLQFSQAALQLLLTALRLLLTALQGLLLKLQAPDVLYQHRACRSGTAATSASAASSATLHQP